MCSTADERPFKCDICGHGFPRKQQRDVHRVRHSKEKTHLCSICGTAFASQVGRLQGMQLVSVFSTVLNAVASSVFNRLGLQGRHDLADSAYVVCYIF